MPDAPNENASHEAASARRPTGLKLVAVALGIVAALALAVVFFPWDSLRGTVNRYVSEKSGRKFEITRHLDVELGWQLATVRLDGVEFANPAWARDPYLLRAQRAEFDIRYWQLLAGELVLPRVSLTSPSIGLQLEEDGRRTWALGKDTSDIDTVPKIGLLQADGGTVDFLARHLEADVHGDFAFDSSRGDMPLSYQAKGRYRQQPLTAEGRTGNVLQLAASGQPPFPIEIDLRISQGRLQARGTVADPATFDGLDAEVQLRGQSLGNLYRVLGVALPNTPPYAISGKLHRQGAQWDVLELQGRLGLSDISGDMRYDKSQALPLLSGSLRSRVLDMDDLGPLIGLPPTARSANAVEGVAPPPTIAAAPRDKRGANRKVLPTAALDFERLHAMNAEVSYRADRIQNVRELPLDKGSVRVTLKEGVLALVPLELGVAGGGIAGGVRIDGTQNPADIRASLDLRGLQLNRMIPKVETMKTSLGRVDGQIHLSGRGNSMAAWLGGASGDVAAMTAGGQISNLLMEILGLDGGEILKFLLIGDRNVTLRCAAVAFDVEKGIMNGRTLVFDSTDTIFYGTGNIDLGKETLNITVRQQPKDKSVLVARTPLRLRGSFAVPRAGVEPGPLVVRGAAAVALGAVNPLLALVATVETGPGRDADCQEVIAEAKRPGSREAAAGAARAKKQPSLN